MNKLRQIVFTAFILLSTLSFLFLFPRISHAYTKDSTSAEWRFSHDYTGKAGKEKKPEGWKRHKDTTLPGAGTVTTVSTSSQPKKKDIILTIKNGADKGNQFKLTFEKTGLRYYLKVKQLDEWRNSVSGSDFDYTLSKSTAIEYSSTTTAAVSASINASLCGLKASVEGSLSSSVEFTQTGTYTNSSHQYKKLSDFDQHVSVRIAPYLYQRFEAYNVKAYKYNPKSKAYDIPVNKINGQAITGVYLSPSTSPTIEYCWGVAN